MMALIRSLTAGDGNVRPTKSEVDAAWVVTTDSKYGTVLKISTFGSDTRASGPKPSQVVEINAAIAHDLIAILTKTFGPSPAS